MIRFFLVQNLQGRTRLSKWYMPVEDTEKHHLEREAFRHVSTRDPIFTSFCEFNIRKKTFKLIYRRYAGLHFIICVDTHENELSYFETIHLFVEILDLYFGSVCELDLVFNFSKVYSLLDEFIIGGEIQELCAEKVVAKIQEEEKVTDP